MEACRIYQELYPPIDTLGFTKLYPANQYDKGKIPGR